MRLWEQGLVATYTLPGYKELIHEHYDAFRRPVGSLMATSSAL